jgi:hypothetical protein
MTVPTLILRWRTGFSRAQAPLDFHIMHALTASSGMCLEVPQARVQQSAGNVCSIDDCPEHQLCTYRLDTATPSTISELRA